MPIAPRYRDTLLQAERDQLESLGRVNAKKLLVARMLLLTLLVGFLVNGKLQAAETWRGLAVEPELEEDQGDCVKYDADLYPYESIRPKEKELARSISKKFVFWPYTCTRIHYKNQEQLDQILRKTDGRPGTDLEHIVARKEAHVSGLCRDGAKKVRKAFAKDLLNITLANPDVNQHEKGARDAGEWMPDENRCWFANMVVRVKRKYGLSVDRTEMSALEKVLSDCNGNYEMQVFGCGSDRRP